jgi:peptide/nickel transport system substrate-binding protein
MRHPLHALAAAILTLLACLPTAWAKDSLVIGVAQFPASLHPYISAQTVQYYVIGLAQRPITAFDPDGRLVCLLCTEVPSLENGLASFEKLPDGTRGLAVTIKLKPDLKWGDGAPVTAADIAFTWQVGRDPSAGFNNNYPWSRADRVDIVDTQTAVLHLAQTLTSYQHWDYLLPKHLEEKILANGGTALDYINHTLYNAAPTTVGLWNGPYVITAYQSGNQIELAPNPAWQGQKPAIRRIVIRLIENTASLQANLLSGDVDMTPSGIGITTDQAIALQRDHRQDFAFFYRAGLSYERIDLQSANKPLADVRVRQALVLGIDRKTMIERLFGGHASVAQTWINTLEPNYSADVAGYPYDPAKARSLLKDAGFTPGPDGIGRNEAGDRLSFEFATTSGNRVRELSQQVMQSQWKAIGVEVIIKNAPPRVFFGQLTRQRAFTGLAEYASATRIGLVPLQQYGSAGIPTAANNYTGRNWSGFHDPLMDGVMAAAETELDPVKQKGLWLKMQQIYASQLPELPLYYREDPDVVPVWLKGYKATGREDYQTYWAEQWHQ